MKKDINKKIIIGFSIGDYNSIGPEIFLKSFSSTNLFKNCIPIIFCEESILDYYKKKFKINIKIKALENLDSIKDQKCIYTFSSKRKEIIPKPGEINKDAGNYAIKSLNVIDDKNSGEPRLSHRIDLSTGMYNGRQILKPKNKTNN